MFAALALNFLVCTFSEKNKSRLYLCCFFVLSLQVKIVPRSFTACADAYLSPCIQTYLKQFVAGFDADFLKNVQVSFMQSDGGLAPIERVTIKS